MEKRFGVTPQLTSCQWGSDTSSAKSHRHTVHQLPVGIIVLLNITIGLRDWGAAFDGFDHAAVVHFPTQAICSPTKFRHNARFPGLQVAKNGHNSAALRDGKLARSMLSGSRSSQDLEGGSPALGYPGIEDDNRRASSLQWSGLVAPLRHARENLRVKKLRDCFDRTNLAVGELEGKSLLNAQVCKRPFDSRIAESTAHSHESQPHQCNGQIKMLAGWFWGNSYLT